MAENRGGSPPARRPKQRMPSSLASNADLPLARHTVDAAELKSVVAEALDERLEACLYKQGGLLDRVESIRALLKGIESRVSTVQVESRCSGDGQVLGAEREGFSFCAPAIQAAPAPAMLWPGKEEPLEAKRLGGWPAASTAAEAEPRAESPPGAWLPGPLPSTPKNAAGPPAPAQKSGAGKWTGSKMGQRARDMNNIDSMHTDRLFERQGLLVAKGKNASKARNGSPERPQRAGRASGAAGSGGFARLLPMPSVELPSRASTTPDLLRYTQDGKSPPQEVASPQARGHQERSRRPSGASTPSIETAPTQANDHASNSTRTRCQTDPEGPAWSSTASPEIYEPKRQLSPECDKSSDKGASRAQNFCRLGSFPFPFMHAKDKSEDAESHRCSKSTGGHSQTKLEEKDQGSQCTGSSRRASHISSPSQAPAKPDELETGTAPPVAPAESPPNLFLTGDLIFDENSEDGGHGSTGKLHGADSERCEDGAGAGHLTHEWFRACSNSSKAAGRKVLALPGQNEGVGDCERKVPFEVSSDSGSEDGEERAAAAGGGGPRGADARSPSPVTRLRLLPTLALPSEPSIYTDPSRDASRKTTTASQRTPITSKKITKGMEELRVKLENDLVEYGNVVSVKDAATAVQDAETAQGRRSNKLRAHLMRVPLGLFYFYGLIPIGTGKFGRCYKNFALAVVSCLLVHSMVLSMQESSMMYVHMLTTCYALGGLVGVASLQWHAVAQLAAVTRLLDQYAEDFNFMDEWREVSLSRFSIVAMLWALMVICRVASALDNACESLGEVGALELVSFSVISGLLAVLSFCQLHVCCVLELVVDKFVVRLTDSLDLHRGIMDWNIVQALLRRAAHTIDSCFLALNTAVLAALLLTGVELLQPDNSMHLAGPDGTRCGALWFGWAFTPVVLVLFTVFQAAAVTEKCSRVPAMVNSWTFEECQMDHGRQYVVQYIMHSAAGFYVKGVRLSAFMALKLAYIFGVVLFTSVTQYLLRKV